MDRPHHHRIIVWLRVTRSRGSQRLGTLTVADIDLTTGDEALTIRGSKTLASTRTIPLLPSFFRSSRSILRSSGDGRRGTPDTPFLATRHGTPVTTNYMWRVVKRVAFEAGVRPIHCTCGTTRQDHHAQGCPRMSSGENRSSVSPHTLRRTFGSDLINRGLRLETVSKLLGHSSTTITERACAQWLGADDPQGALRGIRARLGTGALSTGSRLAETYSSRGLNAPLSSPDLESPSHLRKR